MNSIELKKKVARLWKDTFNDSQEYVSLIFNNIFDPEWVEYEEMGGDVVAALMGVPYTFGNAEHNIKAIYLCGLATRPQFRSRGIMTRLLARINEKARNSGFVFSFLIPADEGLRKYYRDREYVNAFYRVIDNYTSLHDFDREYESILLEQKEKVADLKRRLYANLKTGIYDVADVDAEEVKAGIHMLIRSIEDSQQDLQLLHSDSDIDVIIEENRVSGGQIYYVKNPSAGRISAVAFCTVSENSLNIQKLYSTDLASKYKLLSLVKSANPSLGIRHYIPSIEMDRSALWMRTYGSFMADAPQNGAISITERVYSLAAHAKVYGMARILNFPEILKFHAECRSDLKYSILVNSDDGSCFELYKVRDGNLSVRSLPADDIDARRTHVMSKRDIGEILFRRRDTDNLITEAFGMTSINGAISLLLD